MRSKEKTGSGGSNAPARRLLSSADGVRRPWWRRLLSRKFVVVGLALFTVGCVVGAIAAFVVLRPYYQRAKEFDLAEVAAVELSSTVFSRHGEPIGSIMTENRRPIRFDDIPQHLVDALIATEDVRFYHHAGFDPLGIARAFLVNLRSGEVSEGASTITQQLARQTFDMREVSYQRKITEIFLAARIEKAYSKAEILQHYLNLIYFGNGFFGVESAAQGYFGKPCSELTLEEAATLVGIIKRPNAYNPFASLDVARSTRDHTLRRMHAEGFISKDERDAALAKPVQALPREARVGREFHIMGEIRRRLDEILGGSSRSREGLRIFTSLDPDMEDVLRRAVRTRVEAAEKGLERPSAADATATDPLEAAAVVVDNRTGELIASVGGRDFDRSEFDRAFQARRALGTAFTPFVYGAALEAGVPAFEPVVDGPLDNREVMIGALEGIVGEWGAENPDNSYLGGISAWEAIVYSKNAATVRLGKRAGLDTVLALARKAGFASELKEAPSTMLGQTEVTPAEATLAFTTFANGGVRPEKITIIRQVLDADDNVVYEIPENPALVGVLTPHHAGHVQSALAEVLRAGTGHDAVDAFGFADMPAGGKTGTAYNFTDSWFIGFNSRLTCGVWVGYDKPRPIGDNAYGATLALPVWVDFMNASVEAYPPGEIDPPPGCQKISLCDRSGLRATPFCAQAPVFRTSEDEEGTKVAWVHDAYLLPKEAQELRECDVHTDDPETSGDLLAKSAHHTPRASIAFAQPVYPERPTLEGDDPFGSLFSDEIPVAAVVESRPRSIDPSLRDEPEIIPSATPVGRRPPAQTSLPPGAYPPGAFPPSAAPPARPPAFSGDLPAGAYPPGSEPPRTAAAGRGYGSGGGYGAGERPPAAQPVRGDEPPRALPYHPVAPVPLGPATAPPARGLRPVQPWVPPTWQR